MGTHYVKYSYFCSSHVTEVPVVPLLHFWILLSYSSLFSDAATVLELCVKVVLMQTKHFFLSPLYIKGFQLASL